MRSIDLLQDEHRQITRLLDGLDRIVQRAAVRGQVDGPEATELLGLFDAFADGWHQDKEEEYLFPRLLQRASAGEARRIRSLFHDHSEERRRMMSMRAHVVSAIYGEPLSVREFVRDARGFIQLHRRHMAQENGVVFPMAERLLTDSDDQEIAQGFERVDVEFSVTPSTFERMSKVCDRLDSLDGEGEPTDDFPMAKAE